ncbi:hypothetical protein ACQPZ2_23885 [Nocardia pseudovaccinii]|uniref:hypothetical protein n=1 Tax=Nocardia pseudovaccinii TaxID=189540 RepID=UPI003D8BAEC1
MWIPTESPPQPSDTPANIRPRPATNFAESRTSPSTRCGNDDIAALGTPALVVGVILLVAGFAALLPTRTWPRDYGALLVILVYALYLSLAGSLTMWGFRSTRRPRAHRRPHRP